MSEQSDSGNMQAERRKFLKTIASAGAAVLLAPRNARSQTPSLKAVRLSENMVAVIGAGANVTAADTRDGLVIVDGGRASWRDPLLQALGDAFPGRPARALFNTHWHAEQTGLNESLGSRGVEIIAHENTKLWLSTNVWVRWSDEKYPRLPMAALPTTTFYDSGRVQLAERAVEYGYMPNAHTDGDVFVFFPNENVLVTGGPVSNDGWPVIDWWTGGWTGGMLEGFRAMLEFVNEDTKIVPGSGPLMSTAELRDQSVMYLAIFERIHAMLMKSFSTAEVLEARPTAEYDARMGDPTQFVTLAFQSLWGHLRGGEGGWLPHLP